MPPAPPKPLRDSPAAIQKPGHHAGELEEREAADRAFHQLDEALLVCRHRAGAVLPRHAVDPACRRVRLVAAEQHAAGLGLAVDEIVGIAEARHVARELVPLNRGEGDVLVIDRRRWHPATDHRADTRRPHAGRVDDLLGGDAPVLGAHADDLAVVPTVDAGHAAVLDDLHAEVAGGVGECVGGAVRIQPAVLRHPDATVQRVGRGRGHARERRLRLEQLDVEADTAGA